MSASQRGKVSVITGAARGLGKGYAEALLKAGAKVAILDVLKEEGKKTCEEFSSTYGATHVLFIYADVTDEVSINAAFERVTSELGQVDILINNAGLGEGAGLDIIFKVNTLGLIRLTERAIEHMRQDHGGHGGVIINVGSLAGLIHSPTSGLYHATKHAVVAYTQCRAASLNPSCGIKLVCFNLGFCLTDMSIPIKTLEDKGDGLVKALVQNSGGWADFSAVVSACVRCLQPDVVTGSVILVTGDDGANYVEKKLVKTPFP